MSLTPLFLSPALPSELLTYILNHHAYPTTLIVCSSRSDFLACLADDIRRQAIPAASPGEQGLESSPSSIPPDANQEQLKHQLLSSPLYQIATSRHIRVVYIPTVTHLRAYLAVFTPDDSKVPAPPPGFSTSRQRLHIILYGFLEIHRDTSEWSAQGLSNSASALVELGDRLAWQTVVVEPRKSDGPGRTFEDLLKETAPYLSGGTRRQGLDSEAGGWSGRIVEVGRVMKRWFRFQRGQWDTGLDEDE
ncbi:hypothetical protein F4779DRAFT_471680 [Xylariaceae sp. FL0662B]|nr:hypothetical protein F4779DRAFT_471680 [Xylariaceae sp. FL0662B]